MRHCPLPEKRTMDPIVLAVGDGSQSAISMHALHYSKTRCPCGCYASPGIRLQRHKAAASCSTLSSHCISRAYGDDAKARIGTHQMSAAFPSYSLLFNTSGACACHSGPMKRGIGCWAHGLYIVAAHRSRQPCSHFRRHGIHYQD